MKNSELRDEIREQIRPHLEWHYRRILKAYSCFNVGMDNKTLEPIPLNEKTLPFKEFVEQIPKQKLSLKGNHRINWRWGINIHNTELYDKSAWVIFKIGNCIFRISDRADCLALIWKRAGMRF